MNAVVRSPFPFMRMPLSDAAKLRRPISLPWMMLLYDPSTTMSELLCAARTLPRIVVAVDSGLRWMPIA